MHRSLRMGTFMLAALVVAPTMTVGSSANASIAQSSVVSPTPSRRTPHAIDDSVVANAAVHTFTQVGQVMYAGGKFNSVQEPARTSTLHRTNLFSFDVATGQPSGWAPAVDGEVWRTLYVAPYLYVG